VRSITRDGPFFSDPTCGRKEERGKVSSEGRYDPMRAARSK